MNASMATDPLEVIEEIARIQASLPPLDEEAFELAREAFGLAYARAIRPVLASERDEAHDDAMLEGLMAAVGTYVKAARR